MDRRFVLAIPLLTVLAVGYLALHVGAPQPVVGARLWGGPTDALGRWTGWIEAGQVEVLETPLTRALLTVDARARDGRSTGTLVQLDDDGAAEVELDFGRAPPGQLRVRVRSGERTLLDSDVGLAHVKWRTRTTRQGGYFSTRASGAWRLRVAAERGVFAVPFPGRAWVHVEQDGRAAPDVRLSFQSEGAELSRKQASTDAQGIARVQLTPFEHVVALRIRAELPQEVVEWSPRLPVVPGAMLAHRSGDELRVSSPVEHAAAFVTLLTERGRLGGARVPLTPTGRGGATGVWPLPTLAQEPTWALVASGRASASEAVIGWPLFETADRPLETLEARDVLLADGFPQARQREHARRRRIHGFALGLALLGALFSVLGVTLSLRRGRGELDAHLSTQLDAESAARVLPRHSWRPPLAIALIFLGFVVVALASAARLR